MYRRILILVDSRPATRSAVLEGTALAKVHGAEVTFLSILPSFVLPVADMPLFSSLSIDEFEREAKAAADRMFAAATVVAQRAGVTSRTVSAGGEVASKVIVNVARRRRCDVIVVASEGRNALLRLLTGSVIPGLITDSPVPVLVCKQRAKGRPEARAARAPTEPRSARKRATPRPARVRRERASA
jgi:nucleotide-binding universal stress UspA family protein